MLYSYSLSIDFFEMLRTKVLVNNLVRKSPPQYILFYSLLKKKDYQAALTILSELGEIHERILSLVNSEYMGEFASLLITRTTNELDLATLLGAAAFKAISKEIWLERIKYLGFYSLTDFLEGKNFPYCLFRKDSIDTFLEEMRSNLYFFINLFLDEMNYIIDHNLPKKTLPYAASLYLFYQRLNQEERIIFKDSFLKYVPEIPEAFIEIEILIEKFIKAY